jgi:hypothetical protein
MVYTPINSVLVPDSGKRLHDIGSETWDVNQHVPEVISDLASREKKKGQPASNRSHCTVQFNWPRATDFHYDLDVSMPLFKARSVVGK